MKNHQKHSAGAFIFVVICIFTLTAWDNLPDSVYPVTIKHPGKLSLVYVGHKNNDHSKLIVNANGKEFHVFKDVQEPSVQSIFLLEQTVINPGEKVLDIGTGCGIQAIFAAKNASHVVATDISDSAVANTKYNIKLHHLENKIEVIKSDLFSAIKPGEKFDVIIINIGYPFDTKSLELWGLHERFFSEVNKYLNPQGRIYYEIGLLENIAQVHSMTYRNGLRIMRMYMENAFLHQREPIVFEIRSMANIMY